MKNTISLLLTLMLGIQMQAQDLKLSFTSITDAKFFVYVNGVLQNERSSGMVTVNNLENKEYHVRIVIDDPFEVAVTRSITPDPKHCDYTVQFNAVKERVYLKQSKTKQEESVWQPEQQAEKSTTANEDSKPARQRTTIKRVQTEDSETQQILNRIKTQTMSE